MGGGEDPLFIEEGAAAGVVPAGGGRVVAKGALPGKFESFGVGAAYDARRRPLGALGAALRVVGRRRQAEEGQRQKEHFRKHVVLEPTFLPQPSEDCCVRDGEKWQLRGHFYKCSYFMMPMSIFLLLAVSRSDFI